MVRIVGDDRLGDDVVAFLSQRPCAQSRDGDIPSALGFFGKAGVDIGQRGVGSARPADVQDSLAAGNTIVTARELARQGAGTIAGQLTAGEHFVIVYDVDGTNPSQIPAVRAPVAGGPGVDDIGDLLKALAARGTLCGMVVTEFEPDLDAEGTSALTLARLVCRAIDLSLGSTEQPPNRRGE